MVLPVRAVRDPQDFVLGHIWGCGVSATRLIGRTTISSQDRRPSPSLNSELLPSELEVGFQPNFSHKIYLAFTISISLRSDDPNPRARHLHDMSGQPAPREALVCILIRRV